jgi:hypothetical protein
MLKNLAFCGRLPLSRGGNIGLPQSCGGNLLRRPCALFYLTIAAGSNDDVSSIVLIPE